MHQTILVPLDGSKLAATVLDQVVAVAHRYQARLVLLTVGAALPMSRSPASNLQLTLTFQAEAYLEQVRHQLEAQGIEVHTRVGIGEPTVEILKAAQQHEVELIVIYSRDGQGNPSPFLGSVAARVAGAAAVPVFVLHAPPETQP